MNVKKMAAKHPAGFAIYSNFLWLVDAIEVNNIITWKTPAFDVSNFVNQKSAT